MTKAGVPESLHSVLSLDEPCSVIPLSVWGPPGRGFFKMNLRVTPASLNSTAGWLLP
jgi:hypothetical protein